MSEEIEKIDESRHAITKWANELVVSNKTDADLALTALQKIKSVRDKWVEYWKTPKDKAWAAHKELCAKENEGAKHLYDAEKVVTEKLKTWQNAEREKAEAEQKRLQAIADEQARKERVKIEAAAAIQCEREQKALREQAEALERANNAKNEADRLKAQDEAMKAAAKAEAAAVKADAKAQQSEMITAPIIHVEAEQIKGQTVTWKAVLNDPDMAMASEIGKTFFEFNQSAADKFAKATKGEIKVPGVRFEKVYGLTVRKEK